MIDQVENLSEPAQAALEDSSNKLILHQASSWEIQIKHQTGKLKLRYPPKELIHEGLKQHDIEYAPIDDQEIWHLDKLPAHHRDPFDRLLISSALCGGMRLVTPDPEIQKYPVPILW